MNDTIKQILDNYNNLTNNIDSIHNTINGLGQNIQNYHQEILKSIDQFHRPNYYLLVIGALIGFFISLLYELVKVIKRNIVYYNKYKKFEGIYLIYPKYSMDDPYYCFEVERKKNTFIIQNGISLKDFKNINSIITMMDTNPNYGNGYYRHEPNDKGVIKYGFWEVQLDIDKIIILSHATIYYHKGEQVSNPYVWVKQSGDNPEKILEQYREKQNKMIKNN